MGEWREYRVEDVCSRITSGGTPSRKRLDYFGGTIPWLSSKEVDFCRITRTDEHITELGLRSSSAKWIEPGSIIVAMYGATAGRVALSQIPLTTNQACCNLTVDRKRCENEYLFYYLWNKYDELVQLSSGVAQQNLSLAVLKEFPLLLPDLSEQRAIASVLSSLDAKIDLLHRQNKTLEAMAEALFRQWFVEEAGEGWEEVLLGDLVEVRYGKDHKALGEGNIPVYGSGGVMRYADRALFEGESVLIPRKGTLNNVMYVNEAFWTVDTMFFTEMKRPNMAKFIYHFVKSHDLASMNVGSAVPSMTTAVLNNMPLDIPGPEVFAKYEATVGPLYAKHATNTKQIQSLTALRDTLLPKLMSGEVRVDGTH